MRSTGRSAERDSTAHPVIATTAPPRAGWRLLWRRASLFANGPRGREHRLELHGQNFDRRGKALRKLSMASVRASARTNFYPCRGVQALHLMLHAREAHWQTPVTGAPHLFGRSLLCSDPRSSRARRPLIMMMRSLASRASVRGLAGASSGGWLERGPGRNLAVLQIAPPRDHQAPSQGHDAHPAHALAPTSEAPVEPLGQGGGLFCQAFFDQRINGW
jgi:hypothetical protein